MDASTGLTCICCRVVFANGDIQREHYRTDWHRYNLKRKITGLSPVTEELFRQKVAAYKQETAAEKSAATEVIICECCNKQFQSANAYDNHVSSKKHKENEALSSKKDAKVAMKKASATKRQPVNDNDLKRADSHLSEEVIDDFDDEDDDDSDSWVTDHGTDDEDFDESKGIPEKDCLFCNHSSKDVETNLIHMSVFHGFFLPDAEFCTDVDGMLHYIGLKVGSGNMCLICNERKRFSSLDACQKHMRDKGHCRIARGAEEMIEFEDFYDYSPMYPENEDANESSDIILTDDGYTLTLPSGAKIGHRSLLRYYRQHLKPLENETRNERRGQEALKKVIGQYKALGWTGTSGPVAVQRAKDIRYMKKLNAKNWVKLGLHGNKLFKSRGRVGDN